MLYHFYKIQFVASRFVFNELSFGYIMLDGLEDSLILTKEESISFREMNSFNLSKEFYRLVYRASRAGPVSKDFHSKCDGKERTITIIKIDLNHVFGGHASSAFYSSGRYINDPNAFIFSLRRDEVSFKDKFTVKHNGLNAVYDEKYNGPCFGEDIRIGYHSRLPDNKSNFGHSYNLPNGFRKFFFQKIVSLSLLHTG